MGGRFGKYGDLKRRRALRNSAERKRRAGRPPSGKTRRRRGKGRSAPGGPADSRQG